jgi:hypothetical protein
MNRRCQQRRGWFVIRHLLIGASLGLVGIQTSYADDDQSGAVRPGIAADCTSATKLTFEGNTTITAATLVTSGTLTTLAGNPDGTNLTLAGLPPFCRIQGLSKPTGDSSIYFEVWLPQSTWNGKFLSSGEGGYVGALNYTRLGLDGGLDELLRRGYSTASTDTGHSAADTYWAIGHPEKAIDYLYRAKHLVTVAAKGLNIAS